MSFPISSCSNVYGSANLHKKNENANQNEPLVDFSKDLLLPFITFIKIKDNLCQVILNIKEVKLNILNNNNTFAEN